MRKPLVLIVAMVAAGLSSQLLAQSLAITVRGHVSRIVQKGEQTVITLRGDFANTPTACGYGEHLVIYWVNNKSAEGRALISAALAAGSNAVTATGTGRCRDLWIYRDAQGEELAELY